MVVAEIFLTTFITVLFEKLASADLIKLARSAGIYSELGSWKITLTQIQAVLVDAGQRHITQIAVQHWLHTLHHLAYDIDDLLDDLATEAMRRQLNKGSEASTRAVAFLGGMFAGLLRLDLNEDPLKEWVTRTVEASAITEELDFETTIAPEEPQQIEIE